MNQKYEQFLPAYYKRPTKDDPELVYLTVVMRAKENELNTSTKLDLNKQQTHKNVDMNECVSIFC